MQIISPDFVCNDCANGKVKAAVRQKKSKGALLNSLFNQIAWALPVALCVKLLVICTTAHCVRGTWGQSREHSHWTWTMFGLTISEICWTRLHLGTCFSRAASLLCSQLYSYRQMYNYFLDLTVRLLDLLYFEFDLFIHVSYLHPHLGVLRMFSGFK